MFKFTLQLSILLFLFIGSIQAQERWEWPEHPQNIKALPSNITAEQLRSAMHEFTEGLGVRCNYCHVGEEGKPFTEWDFAADDKENKKRAREMIRMLGDIDDHLAKIEPSGDKRVTVQCYTCHHGRPRPMTLNEEIREAYRKNGLEPAIAHLSDLKEKYYGKGVYNFESDQVLNEFGQSLLDSSKTDEALRVFNLNIEKFPKSSWAWSNLGQAYIKSGNNKEAQSALEKAIELDPRNRFAKRMLDNLKK
ncbi:MAG: c-type cytochrome [Calditrichaeota bacterium]|nr:c-type cytochrome [Calditrichota bacterium]